MKERGRKGRAGVVRFGRASGEEQGRLDAFGRGFFGRENTRGERRIGEVLAEMFVGDVCVVSRLRRAKNWERMGAVEDNERRVMLSRPSLVLSRHFL